MSYSSERFLKQLLLAVERSTRPPRRLHVATAVFAALCLFRTVSSFAQTPRLEVEIANRDNIARPSEVVELPVGEVLRRLRASRQTAFSAHLVGDPNELLTQRYATQIGGKPDLLLLLVDLAPHQKILVEITAVAIAPLLKTRVTARKVPERKDDFAWENDVVAYRVYGPALQATGEITSGIDVWSKRVPDFITESWYQRDLEGVRTHNPQLSYHIDNGQGLDSYEVAASRGCGGTAVFAEGRLYPSQNAVSSRILANGPIRVDFLLDYGSWKTPTSTVYELKRITLDAGSKLNHIHSIFREGDGDTSLLTVASGLGIHRDAVIDRPKPGIVSVWDSPQLETAGKIGTAMIVPHGVAPLFKSFPMDGETLGNALFLFDIPSGGSIDYYAGSAWSQADTPTQAQFDSYLVDAQIRIDRPVSYKWKNSVKGRR